jgi:tRNA dimethylallyltransferase
MSNSAYPRFTLIFGPTATGKSALAYSLAKETGADVLSYDSRHVYKEMNIVTGKDYPPADSPFQLYGVDLVAPDQNFSIRHYYEYALPLISEYKETNKPLILVGGSWLYAQVLLNPPRSLFVAQDKQLREKLSQLSVETLQNQLQRQDKAAWTRLNHSDRNNPRRLIRAIEVASQLTSNTPQPLILPGDFSLRLQILPLEQIEFNIRQRITQRLQSGALEETRHLLEHYPDWSYPAFSSTGYKYIRKCIEGSITKQQLIDLWYQQERAYAKRQLTWIKSLNQAITA